MPQPSLARRRLLAGGGPLLLAPGLAWGQEPAGIVIDHHDFGPAELKVPPGTRVVWTNRDATPHNVVSTDNPRRFRSRILNTGDRFEFTFDAPGRYGYYCALHPQMVGTVLVE